MQLDPEIDNPTDIYSTMIRAITPRPIAWVSTISPSGVTNLAPFSYFNGICSKPAALMFSPVNRPDGSKKDTVLNVEANGQFVVNLVPYSLADQMFATSADMEYEISEFEAVGLTPQASDRVKPPRVAESPVHFECEVMQIVHIGKGPLAANVVIGKILLIDILESVLDARQKIDPALLDTVGRLGSRSYCRTTNRFELK
jgi:flavin reductase (DIM6/NTAB) family NADH-FMN oxidoreductase RutF